MSKSEKKLESGLERCIPCNNSDVSEPDGSNSQSESQEGSDSDSDSDQSEVTLALAPMTNAGHRILPGVKSHSILEKEPLGLAVWENCIDSNTNKSAVLSALRTACRTLNTTKEKANDQAQYSSGQTFWVSHESAQSGRVKTQSRKEVNVNK